MKTTIQENILVTLDLDKIRDVILVTPNSTEAVLAIHGLAVRSAGIDWDQVYQLEGHVRCSPDALKRICNMFMAKEGNGSRPYPQLPVMPGGTWLNYGFSADPNLTGFQAVLPPITMK